MNSKRDNFSKFYWITSIPLALIISLASCETKQSVDSQRLRFDETYPRGSQTLPFDHGRIGLNSFFSAWS